MYDRKMKRKRNIDEKQQQTVAILRVSIQILDDLEIDGIPKQNSDFHSIDIQLFL